MELDMKKTFFRTIFVTIFILLLLSALSEKRPGVSPSD